MIEHHSRAVELVTQIETPQRIIIQGPARHAHQLVALPIAIRRRPQLAQIAATVIAELVLDIGGVALVSWFSPFLAEGRAVVFVKRGLSEVSP
jgi:hypothetical protein